MYFNIFWFKLPTLQSKTKQNYLRINLPQYIQTTINF